MTTHVDTAIPVADGEPPICPWWIERDEGFVEASRADYAGHHRAEAIESDGGAEYRAYGPHFTLWAAGTAPTLAEAMAAADRALVTRGEGCARPPPPSHARWYVQLAVGSPVLLERRETQVATVEAVRNEGGERQVCVEGEWYRLGNHGRAVPLAMRVEQRELAQATRRARHEVRMREIAACKAGAR